MRHLVTNVCIELNYYFSSLKNKQLGLPYPVLSKKEALLLDLQDAKISVKKKADWRLQKILSNVELQIWLLLVGMDRSQVQTDSDVNGLIFWKNLKNPMILQKKNWQSMLV